MPSRRDFLKVAALSTLAGPLAARVSARQPLTLPVPGLLGLELYSVRERMAKVQEGKLQLNREQFEWKKSMAQKKACPNPNLNPNRGQSDDLARLERTLDEVERRTCKTFNLPYDGPSTEDSKKDSTCALPGGANVPVSPDLSPLVVPPLGGSARKDRLAGGTRNGLAEIPPV